MYSPKKEKKSVVAERFIRILKNTFLKYVTVISKNVYFDVFGNIVNKYNSTVHRTIKMKPIDVTSDSYTMKILMKKILNFKLGIMLE